MAGDEARSHLKSVRNLCLLLLPSPFEICTFLTLVFGIYRMTKLKIDIAEACQN
jgi:hypothetical protein